MALSISTLTKEHTETITRVLTTYETSLHPASAEDEEVVRRAVFSVRNKSVKLEKFNPKINTLYATVYDVRQADVSIVLTSGEMTCSCPQNLCRHKLGVALALYQYIGSVQEWTTKWRGKKTTALQSLAAERSPENWSRLVHEVTSHILSEHKKIETYLFSNVVENIHLKLRKYMPLEREWQPVFKLFIELAVLNNVWANLLLHEQKFTADYIEFTLQKRINMTKELLFELPNRAQLFALEPFYKAIQHELRKFVTQPAGLDVKRYELYLAIWKHLFLERQPAMTELASIQHYTSSSIPLDFIETIAKSIINEKSRQNKEATLQLNLLNVSIEDDNSAQHNTTYELTILKNPLLKEHIDLAVLLAQFLIDVKHIESASAILIEVLPGLAPHIQQLPRMYREFFCRNVHELYKNVTLTQQQQIILYAAFGRYGVAPYSEYLLENRLYDEWISLHQLFPSSIAHLEAIGLKQVVEHSPSSALPLYHFYAMTELRQKSRMNYKAAVRIWRAMKSVAKKAGKTAYFEEYIATVRQQYKRLRALQEELDKANFTS